MSTMNIAIIYAVYGTSLLLVSAPLLHILINRRFAKYFVYCVAVLSFIVINLIGSTTENIFNTGAIIPLQLSLLATSIVLAGLYPALVGLGANRAPPLHNMQTLRALAANSQLIRWYLLSLTCVVLCVVLVFSLTISLPLLFRFDLYGNWYELIINRTQIVFGNPKFHWWSLAFHVAPAFLACVPIVMWRACRGAGDFVEAAGWRRSSFFLIPLFMILSVAFLYKSYLAYIIAELFLIFAVLGKRVIGTAAIGFASVIVAMVLLYMVFLGHSVDSWAFAGGLAHRLFEIYPWASAEALHLFPNEMPFLNGTSFINFFNLLPYEQVNVAVLIYPYVYHNSYAESSTPLPALYEMYVNFGWLGFAGGLGIIAAYITTVSLISWSRNPFAIFIAFFLCIYGVVQLWTGPFWFASLEPTLLILCLLLMAIWMLLRDVGFNDSRALSSESP